jgi:hypothetical protein
MGLEISQTNDPWGRKRGNSEVTTQATSKWSITKYLIIRDGPKAPAAIDGPLGPKYYPSGKANAIAIASVM